MTRAALLSLLLLVAPLASAQESPWPGINGRLTGERPVLSEKVTLVILATSGLRGRVEALAKIATVVKRERAAALARGDSFLLFDAGNASFGTLESRGTVVVEALSQLGTDAGAVGHTEFFAGPSTLEARRRASRYPWIATNITTDEGAPVPWAASSVTVQPDGLPLAVVALTSENTADYNYARDTAGLRFGDPLEAARREIEARLAGGTKGAIVLRATRARPDGLAALPGVVAVVGGTDKLTRHRVVLERSTGKVLESSVEALELAAETPDPAIAGLLERDVSPTDRLPLARLVGRPTTRQLASWICELMRRETGAELAFHNLGGVQGKLEPGAVTRSSLARVSPFGNTVVTVSVPGKRLLQIWQRLGSLAWAGLPARFDDDRLYRVATSSFLAEKLDLTGGRDYRDTGHDLLDLTTRGATRVRESGGELVFSD